MFNQDNLKIIQITDTHLFADNSSTVFGVQTNPRFAEVIQRVEQDELQDTDFILLTGDLSQDDSKQSYQHLRDALEKWALPIYWIPGNHDNWPIMKKVLASSTHFHLVKKLETPYWVFLLINSQQEGRVNGYIEPVVLDEIQQELIKAGKKYKSVALIMHHHPREVSTPLIDQYMLDNHQALWNIIEESPVALIITGHVHGDYRVRYKNITMECAPATCFQFKKGTTSLALEHTVGYKIYNFQSQNVSSKAVTWSV